MKKLFVLLISVSLSANFLTISVNAQQEDPFRSVIVTAKTIKKVESSTSGGSITVIGDAVSEAVVEVYVTRDKWSAEEIKKVFEENYTVDINLADGCLYAEAKAKNKIENWNKQGVNISFKIVVPKQINSNLRTSGGSISINNLSGSQDFKTSGGSLSVEDVTGKIVGRTSGGSITIANSNNDIDMSTSGGSIKANDCSGKIKLRTSGGSLHLNNLSGDIDATTSGGSVNAKNVQGALKTGTTGGSVKLEGISGSVEAKTSGGSMNVAMESVSEYVKLSSSGSVNLTLPAGKGYHLKVKANKVETSALKDFQGNMTSSNIEGTVGNGGPKIEIKTSQWAKLSFQ